MNARDPGNRALYVPKIQALIHMRRIEQKIKLCGEPFELAGGLVPAVYRRTTLGMQGLIADGLFSLIPFYSENNGDPGQVGCLGRQYLVGRLSDIRPGRDQRGAKKPPADAKARAAYETLFDNWLAVRRWNYDRDYQEPKIELYDDDPRERPLDRPGPLGGPQWPLMTSSL